MRGGGSYYSQNDLHFGLGDVDRVARLEIRWPNGREELWLDVDVNRTLTLIEGTGRPPEKE